MKPTPAIDERDLLLRLRDGDEVAFEEIYHRYKRRLAGNLLRMVKSDDLADEALQDLFMKLWENRSTIAVDQPIRAYLFRIAENLVFDTYRRAARDKRLREFLLVTQPETYTHVEEDIIQQERQRILDEAISMLPPQRQQVFRLCKLEGRSYDEVSEMLNISTSTVNGHISKANAFLQDYLLSNKHIVLPAIAALLLQGI